jgi:ubiquinone/menaquinone biosynthesis C-methylase UbiE
VPSAAFVLNHLTDPSTGLTELARVTRPGGAVLAAVFSNTSRDPARDKIDGRSPFWPGSPRDACLMDRLTGGRG